MLLLGAFAMMFVNVAAAEDTRVFEMRTYWAPTGKLEALHARFRDHTMKLFEKHGMTNIGYWVPLDNSENKLIYFLAYPSRESREKSWKAFLTDPDWQRAQRESEANGKLVEKVESRFLQATDYSPAIKPAKEGGRIFELRTYTTTPGNLPALNDRFRDHTMRLFARHGMTNVAYWTPMSDQDGAGRTLVYILAHASKEAAEKSFAAFRDDPDWIAARKASEEKAGGSLTIKDGVKSVFMQATDYSPIR
jgi:hypothetical protein